MSAKEFLLDQLKDFNNEKYYNPDSVNTMAVFMESYHQYKLKNDKRRLDILNWAKSELSQEENEKLGKTMNPYRKEKIKFLQRIIDWINK